jgi:hypothetical protein
MRLPSAVAIVIDPKIFKLAIEAMKAALAKG